MLVRRHIFILLSCFMLITEYSIGQNMAKIYGKITDKEGIPIEGVNIVVQNDNTIGTSTTESGRYELLIPHDRPLTIEISCMGYATISDTVMVNKGKRKQLDYTLEETVITMPAFNLNERYTLSDEDLKPINPKVLSHLPGVSQSVESLIKASGLGVFSSNELTSQYNVRGGNYDENLIYLNGIEVYRPLLIRSGNQEGLSFINPDMVSSINFSAGGFDACYGDKMSSVLDVNYKIPIAWGGSISASLLGATGHVEGCSKDKKFSILAGVRYQSNAYLFRKMQDSGSYKPTFTDVQLLLNYQPNAKWAFSLFGNYTRNVYRFMPVSRETNIGTVNFAKKLKIYFEGNEVDAYQTIYSAFTARYQMNDNNKLRFILSYFNSIEKETFDILSQYFLSEVNTSFGSEDYGEELSSRAVGSDMHHGRNFLISHLFNGEIQGSHLLKHNNTLSWSAKMQGEIINDNLTEWRLFDSSDYSLPMLPTTPGDSVALDDPSRVLSASEYLKVSHQLASYRLSAYVQDKWNFGNDKHHFSLIGGIRFSYWNFNREFFVTPRLRLVYQPQWKVKTQFYLAAGMYFQPPFYKEMRREDGSLNKDIQSQRSYHVIIGSDVLFTIFRRPFKFSTEVYYKYLDKLITYSLDNVRVIYSALNDATGYAIGMDAKLSGEIVHDLESWISFSIMQSKESINHGEFTPRPTDQRVSMNLYFQDRVPKLPMLKAHINMVFATALPYSFPHKRAYTNRSKAYFRTDIGLSWQFIDEATRLGKKKAIHFINAAYLTFEITNLFNYSNILSYTWVSDIYNQYYAIPNYLSPRMYNVKIRFEF